MVSMALAVSVLLQFGFVSVNSMTCLMSGDQMVSVGELDGCCSAESTSETSIDAKCCKFEVNSKIFDVYHDIDRLPIIVAALPAAIEPVAEFIVTTQVILNATWLANPPPILHGASLLVFISKYSL